MTKKPYHTKGQLSRPSELRGERDTYNTALAWYNTPRERGILLLAPVTSVTEY